MRPLGTPHSPVGVRRVTTIGGFAAFAATLVLATPSWGAAAEPVIETLSPAESSARDVRVAVAVDGNALAMFFYGDDVPSPGYPPAYCKRDDYGQESDDCTVGSRSWSPDGTLSDLQDLSARFSGRMGQGEVAADGTGRAFAVWGGTSHWGGVGGTVLRVRSTDGTWSGAETLSADPFDPQVAVDDQGVAVVAWRHPVNLAPFDVRSRVQTRARAVNGTLSAIQDISPAGKEATNLDVAVNSDGDAVIVWQAQLTDGSGRWTVQARARSADGTLSDVQSLSSATVNAWNPHVAVEADGDALVVWQLGFGTAVQARARAADGTLSAVTNLSNDEEGSDPQLAMTPDGDALVVWSHGPSTLGDRIKARARAAAGTWSAVETVSLPPGGGYAEAPQVAMDASGRAVVVWSQESVSGFVGPTQIRARWPGEAWSSVDNLSNPTALTWQPQVAVNAGGKVIAAWEDYESDWGPAIHAVSLSVDDLPPDTTPPETTIKRGPNGETTRRTVSFTFKANEAGSSFRCKLDARAWRTCSSPKRYSSLAFGRHVFRVIAIDPSGNVDPTPARRVFRVVRG